MIRLRFLLAVACLLPLAAKGSDADSYLPGGEEAKKAVATRRGKTELSKLAASMKPGTMAELKTTMPKGLWTSPPPSRGLHIAGWTDDAHWDSRTGQFLYMGMRQTRQFIAYSEEKNEWRVIELDKKSDNPCFQSKFGHIYSSNGFDHERSRFYHRYNGFESEGLKLQGGISFFDVPTEKWTKIPPIPENSTFRGQAIEYFSAMDGLILLAPKTWVLKTGSQKWEPVGDSPVDGYHSLIRHNPYRSEILMAGGNQQPRTVARITKAGKIEKLKDFPSDLSVRSDRITVDPLTGNYLILEDESKKLYEFNPDKSGYVPVENFKYPYGKYPMPVWAFIPEYGVVMWAEPSGVFLYKHASVATNATAAAPQAGAEKSSTTEKAQTAQ